jgi:hypothetical protein
MAKYGLDNNATFGWAPKHYNSIKDVLFNGRACRSGLAVPISKFNSTSDTRPEGLCVSFDSIVTDVGTYVNPETDAPQCFAVAGSYCQYLYTDPLG